MIDFGCGPRAEAIELAGFGARRVIGVDISHKWLTTASSAAEEAGVSSRCTFCTTPTELADVIISLDSSEHFEDRAAILRIMAAYLRPNGEALVSFGPPWYHPLGGHRFSVFPWAHLLFTEPALLRWRKNFYPKQSVPLRRVSGQTYLAPSPPLEPAHARVRHVCGDLPPRAASVSTVDRRLIRFVRVVD